MIPILCDHTKTLAELYADKSCGLGYLAETTEATVHEERNGAYTAKLKYPITGKHFSEIVIGGIVKMKPNEKSDIQMFRIKNITKPLNGIVTLEMNHISYDLTKTSVSAFSATGISLTLSGIKNNITGGSAFSFGSDITNEKSGFTNAYPQSARALLGGQEGSVLDVFGGEYEWDNLEVHLWAHRGADNGVTIRYGKNLTDLEQTESIDSVYTAVMPYAIYDNVAVTGTLITLKDVADDDIRVLNLDVSSYLSTGDEAPTADDINTAAEDYIAGHSMTSPKTSLKVSFVNLWQARGNETLAALERVSLCDTVTVLYGKLGVSAKIKVITTDYNVLKERYTSIELGDAKSNFVSKIAEITKKAEEAVTTGQLDDAIRRATDLITGATGGYFYISYSAEGKPSETFWLDTEDPATAVQVLRINKNGIGFSSNGIGGPYRTAWTHDGHFVADFIDSGTMTASLMKAGVLADAAGKNFWNMETGDAAFSSSITVGGESVASQRYVDNTARGLQDNIDANQEEIATIKSGVHISGSDITIGASDSSIMSKFTSEVLQFIDAAGTILAWLSPADGLGTSKLAVGDETDSSKRWKLEPWGTNNTHFKIYKHA